MRPFILCLLCCFLLFPPVFAADPVVVVPVEGTIAPADTPTPAARLRPLNLRERKALGLTFRDLQAEAKAQKAAGTLEGKTGEDLAIEILSKRADTPEFKELPGGDIDWDAVLDFLAKLFDLIIKLVTAFGTI